MIKSTKNNKLFEELGFSPEESVVLELKSDIYVKICKIVEEKGYSRRDLEKIFDVPQSRVSELMTGKLDLISLDKLVNYVIKLGHKVSFDILPEKRKKAL